MATRSEMVVEAGVVCSASVDLGASTATCKDLRQNDLILLPSVYSELTLIWSEGNQCCFFEPNGVRCGSDGIPLRSPTSRKQGGARDRPISWAW